MVNLLFWSVLGIKNILHLPLYSLHILWIADSRYTMRREGKREKCGGEQVVEKQEGETKSENE